MQIGFALGPLCPVIGLLCCGIVPALAASEQPRAATTCVADDSTPASRYSTGSGKITFKGAATGVIDFWCDVSNPASTAHGNPDWSTLLLTARDDGPKSFVEAKLFKKHRTTGATTAELTLTSSDRDGIREDSKALPAALDFNQFGYFLRVRLQRSSITANPEFHAVTLGNPLTVTLKVAMVGAHDTVVQLDYAGKIVPGGNLYQPGSVTYQTNDPKNLVIYAVNTYSDPVVDLAPNCAGYVTGSAQGSGLYRLGFLPSATGSITIDMTATYPATLAIACP